MTTTQDEAEVTLEDLQAEIERLKAQRRSERKNTVDIARKYAEAHGLCSVIDQALTEAGYLGGDKAVQVDVNIPIRITFGVDEGTTEAEIRAMLQDKAKFSNAASQLVSGVDGLGAITSIANGRVRRQDPTVTLNGSAEILEIRDFEPGDTSQIAADGTYADWAQPPAGFLALYTGYDGRKVHFVEAIAGGGGGRPVNVGGIQFFTNLYAMCSTTSYGWSATASSPQNVGHNQGICTRCRERATASHGWRGVARQRRGR